MLTFNPKGVLPQKSNTNPAVLSSQSGYQDVFFTGLPEVISFEMG